MCRACPDWLRQAAVAVAAALSSSTVAAAQASVAPEQHGWTWYLGYVAVAAFVVGGVWLVQQRRVALEAEYRRKLESEVRRRTRELAERNDDLAAANEKLLEASLTDPLTGLRNRRFLFEEVGKHVELIRRWYDNGDAEHSDKTLNIVFLMIDLDHFKPVNDRCGHAAGDEILMQVRDVLLELCRSSDFVIRWGGDEFVVVSRNARIDQIETLAERIRSEISRRVFELDDAQVVRTSCSIGFSCYPFVQGDLAALDWEQVLGLADAALLHAKKHRDAWVGYLGTSSSISYDQLLHAIRRDPLGTAADGSFDIRTSPSVALGPVQHAS